jgi:hypothetical protein
VSQPLTVRRIGVQSLSFKPSSLVGGNEGNGTVKLECKAAPGPITILPGAISAEANGVQKTKSLSMYPAASASPTRLNLVNQVVGTMSAALTTTLCNKGASPLAVDSIGLVGTYAAWFDEHAARDDRVGYGSAATVNSTPACAHRGRPAPHSSGARRLRPCSRKIVLPCGSVAQGSTRSSSSSAPYRAQTSAADWKIRTCPAEW